MNAAAPSPEAAAPEEDVTTSLYRAAIGPVGAAYYLPIFTRFEAANHAGISWNTAAALATFPWLVFRQLWAGALAYVGAVVAVVLLVFGIGQLVFHFSDTLTMALSLGFGLAAFVLPGLFGNVLLYTETRKRMGAALAAHADPKDACAQLAGQASTRRRAIALAVACAAFWLLVLLAYLQLSSLGDAGAAPQGALDSGQVVVGRAVDATTPASAPLGGASAPATAIPIPASPTSSIVAVAASAPVVALASAPASAPVSAPASAPVHTASAPANVRPPPLAASAAANKQAPKVVKAPPKAAAASAAPQPRHKASAPGVAASNKPYYVNVGLFAKPENAARAHAKLVQAQLPSVAKELKTAKASSLTRVRVGPFKTRQDAQAAAEKIKSLQLDAIIVQP